VSCAVGLALALASGRSVAGPEDGSTELGMGKVSVQDVDEVLRMRQAGGESALEFSGVMSMYYTTNFANTTSWQAGAGPRYNSLRPNRMNSQFAVEVFQLQVEKKTTGVKTVGFLAKLDLAQRASGVGDFIYDPNNIFAVGPPVHQDIYLEELYLTYEVPMGRATEKGIGLVLKAGRMESTLGAEDLGVGNPCYSLSNLRQTLPASGTGVRADLSVKLRNGEINGSVSLLNGNEFLGLINGPFGNSTLVTGENNNAVSLETSVSYKHNFSGPRNPWIEGLLGISWGPEVMGNTADALTTFNLAVSGGLDIKGRKFDATLEYAIGRQEPAFGTYMDWQALSGTVQYEISDRITLALRAEYLEDQDGYLMMLQGLNPGYASSLWVAAGGPSVFSVTLSMKAEITTKLTGIVEFRHDQSSTDGSVNGGIFWDDAVTGRSDSQDTLTLAVVLEF